MPITRRAITPGLFATVCLFAALPATAEPAAPAPTTPVAPPVAPVPSLTAVAPSAPPIPAEPAPNPAPEAAAPAAPTAAATPGPAAPAAPAADPTAPPAATQGLTPAPPAFDPTRSFVHLASSHPATELELKSSVDDTDWQRVCVAPCDRSLVVLGMLARASAPGMTTSNVFRIQPGTGPALVKVEGGSSSARTLGVIGIAAGLPIALGGATLFSYGKVEDRDGLAIAGAVILGTGALAVLVALPLLVSGKTSVKNADGRTIAGLGTATRLQ